jgi:hypothetical protein
MRYAADQAVLHAAIVTSRVQEAMHIAPAIHSQKSPTLLEVHACTAQQQFHAACRLRGEKGQRQLRSCSCSQGMPWCAVVLVPNTHLMCSWIT